MSLGERVLQRIDARERARQAALEEAQRREIESRTDLQLSQEAEKAQTEQAQAIAQAAETQRLLPYLLALEPNRVLEELKEFWQVGSVIQDTHPLSTKLYLKSQKGFYIEDPYKPELGVALVYDFPATISVWTGKSTFVEMGIVDGMMNGYDQPIYEDGIGTAHVGFRISVAAEPEKDPYFRAYYFGYGSTHSPLPFLSGGNKQPFSLTDTSGAQRLLYERVELILAADRVLMPQTLSEVLKPTPSKQTRQEHWLKRIFG